MASMTDFRWNLAIELLESVIINSYFFEEYSRKKNLPSLISNTIVNIEFWQGVLRLIEHIKPICIALDIVQSDSIRFGESIGVIVAISFANLSCPYSSSWKIPGDNEMWSSIHFVDKRRPKIRKNRILFARYCLFVLSLI